MNLHSLTLSFTLLASTCAMAQEPPPRLGGTRNPEPAKVRPAEQAGAPAENADPVAQDSSGKAATQAAVGKRLPQLDNPLDPNRPRKSTREPAKIRPAEQSSTPAENAKPVKRKPAAGADKADDANDAKPAEKQASRPPRRAVALTVGSMPATQPVASYGPTLTPQVGGAAALPGGPLYGQAGASGAPIVPAAPNRPAVVNSCDSGGCTDSNGVRYNGGVGNAMIGPQGQLCHRTGVTMQC